MRIKILPNPRKKWASESAGKVKDILVKLGHKIVFTNANATVCIGGDGTILFANHVGGIQGKVLGIGSHTSAICKLNRKNWRAHVTRYIENKRTEKRYMIKAAAGHKSFYALNDFVIHTTDYRVLKITVEINDKKHVFEGDGIIIATATGSTAYAYSAGGKKLQCCSNKISIVPIAPYMRLFKPLIRKNSVHIAVSCDRESAFIVDGIFIRYIRPREKVKFSKGRVLAFCRR